MPKLAEPTKPTCKVPPVPSAAPLAMSASCHSRALHLPVQRPLVAQETDLARRHQWTEDPSDRTGAGRLHQDARRHSGDPRHGRGGGGDRPGVIDGAITASSGCGYVWRDLLKYSLRLNVSFIDSLVLVNKGAWEKLPPDTRRTVQAIVDNHTRHMTDAMAAKEDLVTRKLAAEDMVVTDPSKADIALAESKMTPYWKDRATGRPGSTQEAMRKVMATSGR